VLSHEDRRAVVEKTVVTSHHTAAMINMFAVMALTATNVSVFAGDPGSRFTLECNIEVRSSYNMNGRNNWSEWSNQKLVLTFDIHGDAGKVFDEATQKWTELKEVTEDTIVLRHFKNNNPDGTPYSFGIETISRKTGEYYRVFETQFQYGENNQYRGTCEKIKFRPAPANKF
jgi:hypothetical protein